MAEPLTPEQAWEAAQAYGRPGPHHAALRRIAGTFGAVMHVQMSRDRRRSSATGGS